MSNSFWFEKIRFGSLEVPRFMVAPLDGITDSPLRRLIRDFSVTELMFTEMRHVSCVCYERGEPSLRYQQVEQPLAFQFSANRLDLIDEAVEKVIAKGFVMINLNCGCPAPAVIKSGSGSALMADKDRLTLLIKQFIKAINGRIPFTIKIRAGFKERNAVDIAKLAQDLGVDGLIIHPRTQPEGFASRLDYDLTAKVKAAVNIPLIFSGNINRFEQAEKVYAMTGVDGFMIGRALWGAPWKMREMTDAAAGKVFSVDTKTSLDYCIRHLDLNMEHYGSRGFSHFKKQIPQYIRTVQGASEWRAKLLRTQNEAEMRVMLDMIVQENTPVNNPDLLPTASKSSQAECNQV
jgi:tRNA-dihydrouridine synthase B